MSTSQLGMQYHVDGLRTWRITQGQGSGGGSFGVDDDGCRGVVGNAGISKCNKLFFSKFWPK